MHVKWANRKDSVGIAVNAVVVNKWRGEEYKVGEEKLLLSSLPVERPLEVLDSYDLRSLIGNMPFRELKQGWLLQSHPKKTEEAVGVRVRNTGDVHVGKCFSDRIGPGVSSSGVRRRPRAPHKAGERCFAFLKRCYGLNYFRVQGLSALWRHALLVYSAMSAVALIAYRCGRPDQMTSRAQVLVFGTS